MKLLKTLPVNQQVIINLFIIEEMSHKEIAAQLGISEEASRVQLSRAKKVFQITNYQSLADLDQLN
jgi:RNA polymerase sigma-70 factor (ECF subfamily)